MARFRCEKCGHMLRRRHAKSDGREIRCPQCGVVVYRSSKPLHPPKATHLRKTTLDKEDNR